MKVRRLVFHGDGNISRFELTDDGELCVDLWDEDKHVALTFERDEMRELHAFLGRALAKPVRK